MEKVIKQLTEAISKSRGVLTLKKAINRSHINNKRKFVKDSLKKTTYVNLKGRKRCQRIQSKINQNHYSEDITTQGLKKSLMSSRSNSSTLQLSIENLLTGQDKNNYSDHQINTYSDLYPAKFVHLPSLTNQGNMGSSSWSLRGDNKWIRRTDLGCPDCSYKRLGASYDNFYYRRRTRHFQGRKKETTRFLVIFCKSFCFLLLMVSFIIVIVIVSVFLSKGLQIYE